MKSIKEIESYLLSDGGHATIDKLGRTYTFARTYNSFTLAPDVTTGLDKNTAYQMLANTLQNDVMEVN